MAETPEQIGRRFAQQERAMAETHRWLPMDQAPRDGREIVALANDGAWIVTWNGPAFLRDVQTSAWRIKALPGRDPVTNLYPLGWMPLPDTPTGASDG